MSEAQTYAARHEDFCRLPDCPSFAQPQRKRRVTAGHPPTVGVPLHRDPRYLREFQAWAEGQYPLGTPGHAAVRAVLKGLRSAVYRAKREGRCLFCGGTR